MNGHNFIKPLIEQFLRDPDTIDRNWTVQGFGMLRTYFGPNNDRKRFRLNLWDDRLAVPNVSTIHDHPWHFESMIVAGVFVNRRFTMLPPSEYGCPTHTYTTIKTGEGGGIVKSEFQTAGLRSGPVELYEDGAIYSQLADEIHESVPARGTITLNERTRVGDGEHARVFWPIGTDWVDAEPREATIKEVVNGIMYSLKRWF